MPPLSRSLPALAAAALLSCPSAALAGRDRALVAETSPSSRQAMPTRAARLSAIADAAASWAESKVGVLECSPEQATWTETYGNPCYTLWCGEFVGSAYRAAGLDLGPDVYGMTELHEAAHERRSGLVPVPPRKARRGDLVLMYTDASQMRPVTHVGMATGRVTRSDRIPTVEGNVDHRVVRSSASLRRRVGDRPLVVMVVRLS